MKIKHPSFSLLAGLAAGALLSGGIAAAIHAHRAPLRALRSPDYTVCADAAVDVAEAGRTDAVPYLLEIVGGRRASPTPVWNALWALHRLTGLPWSADPEGCRRRLAAGETGPSAPAPLNQSPGGHGSGQAAGTADGAPRTFLQPDLQADFDPPDPGGSGVRTLHFRYALLDACTYEVLESDAEWYCARRYDVPREREVVANVGRRPPFLRVAVYRRDGGAWVHHWESWYRIGVIEKGAPPVLSVDQPFESSAELVCPAGGGPYRVVLEAPDLALRHACKECLLQEGSLKGKMQTSRTARETVLEVDVPAEGR